MKLPFGYEVIKAAASPPRGELGGTGTLTMPQAGNIVLTEQDYNPELRGKAFYDTIDRMRLSDSQVKAVMSIVKLPLLAADWGFEPASDDSQDVEIAEWLEDRFFNHQQWTWDYVLRHMLLALDYGSMVMETVWSVVDDDLANRPMVRLAKLAPRMPRTILAWRLSEDGSLDGILQQLIKDGEYREISIPGDRLVTFVHDMEGSNYRGTSMLRQARKDWHIKERLQRINQVAIEKRASGIDVGKETDQFGGDQKASDAMKAALQTIRTHERNYLYLPHGFEYEIAGITGTAIDPLPSIKYCDLMITMSVLADFLQVGHGETGSWSLSKDKSSMYLLSLNAISDELRAPINRDLIPKWVNWNWPNVKEYPQLTHSRLDRRDVAVLADSLSKLIPQGVLTPDRDIEKELRELLELPELLDETLRPEDMPEPGPMDEVVEDPDNPDAPQQFRRAKQRIGQKPRIIRQQSTFRPRTKAERAVDWHALARGLDGAEQQIINAYKAIQTRQIAKLAEEGMKVITGDVTAGEKAAKLENINVPFRSEAATNIVRPLLDLYRLGQSEVRQEMARMGGEPLRLAMPLDAESDGSIFAFLRARARMVADALASRLRGSLLRNGMDMIRDGSEDRLLLEGALYTLSDRDIRREAGLSVSEALNLGRESTAKRNELLVRACEYSAILDGGTCDPCQQLDGRRFQFGTPQYEAAKPPYQSCDGRGRCRCTFIYTFESEALPRG